MSGSRPWFKHPGRWVGVAISASSAAYLLLLLHVGLSGRISVGLSVRLAPGEVVGPGGPVAYSYFVAGVAHRGSRSGIDYGGQELSVAYSPLLPWLHLTSTRPGLRSARSFWAEPDYWLRLLLALGGVGVGWGVERAWARFERRGGVFLAGLSPDEP